MNNKFGQNLNQFTGFAAVGFLFCLLTLLAGIEIKDVDLWLHLAVGKHILQTFELPKVDFLSCTIAGAPWNNHEWLFQIILEPLYRNFGIDGLLGFRQIIVFSTFVLLLGVGIPLKNRWLVVMGLLMVLLTYQVRMTLRPDIFSVLFVVLYLIIPLGRRYSPWVFAIMQICWTNMHGYFIWGPVILIIMLSGELLKRKVPLPGGWSNAGKLGDEDYRGLMRIVPVVILSCLVNPHFIEGFLYPLNVLFSYGGESAVFFDQIKELQRPITWSTLFSKGEYLPYKLMILISLGGFVLNRRKINVTCAILWVVFLLFSLTALRNMIYFAVLAYVSLLMNIASIEERGQVSTKRALSNAALNIALIVFIGVYGQHMLLRGYYDFDRYERKSEYGGLSLRNFPIQAADYLLEHNIRGRFFNDFNSGAYLLGRTYPNIKVFIDGRTEVYGPEFFREYQRILKGEEEALEEAAERSKFTCVFLSHMYVPVPADLTRYLYESADWRLIYFDYDATIFLRNIPQNRPLIEKLSINLDDWQVPETDLERIGHRISNPYRNVNRGYELYNMGLIPQARAEAQEALRINPTILRAKKLLLLTEQQ